jgi:hypothetical protein
MVEAAPLRQRVQAELLVQDGAPSVQAIEQLAARSDVGVLLAEIAVDEAEPPLARHRALSLLAQFPSRRGRDVLERVKQTAATPYTRSIAARALERLAETEPAPVEVPTEAR